MSSSVKTILLAAALLLLCTAVPARSVKKSVQRCGMDYLDRSFAVYDKIQKQLHDYAEPGYHEYKSSALLASFLEENGFAVERGVAGIPTAFVATYGSGHPVIGVMAEYDALPGLSQDTVAYRKPLEGKAFGHGCGHNLIGTAAAASGVSISRFLAGSGISGTVKVFGCPAEEGGGGKAYMTQAGCFDGCDAVFDWHPAALNEVPLTSGKANIGVKFSFHGTSAHASSAPWNGRSALDAVEAFDYMMNMMREHLPAGTLFHYVITHGGEAPNVVPEYAQVYYYFRHPKGTELREILPRAIKAAEGAALGTGTTMEYEIVNGNYERLINRSLASLMLDNLKKVGGLDLDDREKAFVRDVLSNSGSKDIEKELGDLLTVRQEFGPAGSSGGSSDVGNVSQVVPVARLRVSTTTGGIHTWQQTAIGGTTIGTKALLNVAKIFYLTAVGLYTDPAKLKAIRDEFEAVQGPDPVFVPLMGDRKPPLDYAI
ncbi:MAG: amidohydrolase [Bacteroidales bacterium]|nr:amidohydrolase [Bacteroidales bacterium]